LVEKVACALENAVHIATKRRRGKPEVPSGEPVQFCLEAAIGGDELIRPIAAVFRLLLQLTLQELLDP
jgi:hypothetical protein